MKITPLEYCERLAAPKETTMFDNRRLWMDQVLESQFVIGEGDRSIRVVEGEVYRRFYALLRSQEKNVSIPEEVIAYHCQSTVNHCFGVSGHYPSQDEMHGESLVDARRDLQLPFAMQWRRSGDSEHAQVVAAFDDEADDAILFEKAGNFGPYYISGLKHRRTMLSKEPHTLAPYFYAPKSS